MLFCCDLLLLNEFLAGNSAYEFWGRSGLFANSIREFSLENSFKVLPKLLVNYLAFLILLGDLQSYLLIAILYY